MLLVRRKLPLIHWLSLEIQRKRQTHFFIIWTTAATHKTSAQPEVELRLPLYQYFFFNKCHTEKISLMLCTWGKSHNFTAVAESTYNNTPICLSEYTVLPENENTNTLIYTKVGAKSLFR